MTLDEMKLARDGHLRVPFAAACVPAMFASPSALATSTASCRDACGGRGSYVTEGDARKALASMNRPGDTLLRGCYEYRIVGPGGDCGRKA